MDKNLIFWTFWVALSFAVAPAGRGRAIGYWGAFILSIVISPLLSYLITTGFFSRTIYKCRWCGNVEYKPYNACPKCGKDNIGREIKLPEETGS
jgi:hypothetical protein